MNASSTCGRRGCAMALALALAACGVDGGALPVADHVVAAAVAAPNGPHQVVVWATASLEAPFQVLARQYEAAHPGAKVVLRCEGGAALLAAMNAGERADVVAIGDSSLMSRFAGAAHLASHSAAELARNRIAIVVPAGNPKNVQSLRDLARPDLRVALGQRSSSIGRYARWALSRLEGRQGNVQPTFEGATAAALLAKLVAGDVDAAIVYATTLRGVAGVERIEVPEAENQPVLYSIAVTRLAAEPRGAAAFRELALSDAAKTVFQDLGFLPVGAK